MKYITMIAAGVVALAIFGAEIKIGPAVPPDPEKEAQRRQAKRHAKLVKTGGRINDMRAMKGAFRFVNCGTSASTKFMKAMCSDLQHYYMSDIEVIDFNEKVSMENVGNVLGKIKAEAAVFFLESDTLPSMLVAPESRWAFVNVKALRADKPDDHQLERRIRKEFHRAFAVLVCSGATVPVCVSKVATSLEELDNLSSASLSSEVMFRGEDGLKSMGVHPYRRTTYREACQEGWAPAPTNEFQKAIFEQVKADKERGPTNPIKIEPPKK